MTQNKSVAWESLSPDTKRELEELGAHAGCRLNLRKGVAMSPPEFIEVYARLLLRGLPKHHAAMSVQSRTGYSLRHIQRLEQRYREEIRTLLDDIRSKNVEETSSVRTPNLSASTRSRHVSSKGGDSSS